jgi:hypothetical protein
MAVGMGIFSKVFLNKMRAKLQLQQLRWVEELIDGLTRKYCIVKFRYSGPLEGESSLMLFPNETQTAFVGLERIAARTDQQLDELYVHHVGTIDEDWYISTANVISGAGAGDLPGMRDYWKMIWTEQSEEAQLVPQP